MLVPARIDTPPQNLVDYAREISQGLNHLYGTAAATHYERVAVSGVMATLSTPGITAWGLNTPEGQAAGMIFARVETDRTLIFFFHVLEAFRGEGHEARLLECVLRDLAESASAIYTEYIPFFDLEVDSVYERFGFRRVMRQIMRRDLDAPSCGPGIAATRVTEIEPDALEGPARVLAEAYVDHPERHLFCEVHSESHSAAYLQRAISGYFGVFRAGYALAVWDEGQCMGVAMGCEVLSGVGFVLHIAVRPNKRGQGFGGALLEQMCENFARQGLRYVALGVTCDNPATTLYTRAGFSPIINLPVFFRAVGPGASL